MKIHPDVASAHAQFGGDLETMQRLYDAPAKDADIARLKQELAEARAERDRHKTPPSTLQNCDLHPRRDVDWIFHFNGQNPDGSLYGASVNLDGYVIIPKEKFARIRAETIEECAKAVCRGCEKETPINPGGYHQQGSHTTPCHAVSLRALAASDEEALPPTPSALWPPASYDGPGGFDGPTGAE